MSEERLQEIKDSIEFQYTLAKAKGYDNALLFTNEEEELVEEIERLNNIIKEVRMFAEEYKKEWIEYDEVQEDMNKLLEILGGENNEKCKR